MERAKIRQDETVVQNFVFALLEQCLLDNGNMHGPKFQSTVDTNRC